MGRPFGERRKLSEQWVKKYRETHGVTMGVLRHFSGDEFEQLMRMQDHARATIFSSLKWEREHSYRKVKKAKPVRRIREHEARIDRLVSLAFREKVA